jgi:hypothetical protein
MSKTIVIKLKCAGSRTGPFDISDDLGEVLGTDVPKSVLIAGYAVTVNDAAKIVTIKSVGGCNGKCVSEISIPITTTYPDELAAINFVTCDTGSIWRHLTNPEIYNIYYGVIDPYIIEYPFAYKFQDEILQNVKDYTKAYKYLPSLDGVWDYNRKIETDDRWFNKAVLYNGQQSSGILELVPKPKNNLAEYMKYPIYGTESKTITYTKSDNFYQYNTFWGLVKDKSIPLFVTSCCYTLSVDKVVNQPNMDYSKRSFKKEPLRAKDLKVRHILDNSCTTHLVSQFIVTPAQISYK